MVFWHEKMVHRGAKEWTGITGRKSKCQEGWGWHLWVLILGPPEPDRLWPLEDMALAHMVLCVCLQTAL